MISKPRAVLLGLVLVATALMPSACDEGPENGTVEAVVRSIATTFCGHIRECEPEGFDAAHGSISGCVDAILANVPASDLKKESVCTDADVAACNMDIKGISCSAALQAQLPSSCLKC